MTIGHQYFCSKWFNSAHAMTPLHGGATSGLKHMTHPHYRANKLTEDRETGEMLLDRERMHTIDNYMTTESDKTVGTKRLWLSSGEDKSLELTSMGNINIPLLKKEL